MERLILCPLQGLPGVLEGASLEEHLHRPVLGRMVPQDLRQEAERDHEAQGPHQGHEAPQGLEAAGLRK